MLGAKAYVTRHNHSEGLPATVSPTAPKRMNAMQLTTKLVNALDPAIQEARNEARSLKQLHVQQLVNLQASIRDWERDLNDPDWEICKLQDRVGVLRSWLAQMEREYDNAKAALKMHKTIHDLLEGHRKDHSHGKWGCMQLFL